MDQKGSGTATGGNGLVIAGVVIAALIGAGVFFSLQDDGRLSDEETSSLASPVETTALDTPSDVEGTADEPDSASDRNPEIAVAEKAEPVADTATDTETAASEERAEQAANDDATALAPSIDEVRVDENGILVVAGRAAPGSRVDVLVDGEVVTSADADASGAFAALGSMSAHDTARTLTLQTGEGAEAVASDEEIILAPVRNVQAAATPAAEGAAEEETETAGETELAALDPAASEQDETDRSARAAPNDKADDEDSPATDTARVEEEQVPAEEEESSQIAVLRSDQSGVSLVEQAPATSVVLDTIGYSDAGDVQLGGRAGVNAVEIRAYLNNRAVARLPVTADGSWRGEVPDVDAGVYTLRVDALAADGTVASRIETPFKREEPAVLAEAIADADGPVRAITVQAGDTLWAIARDRYGEGLLYVQVFEANRDSIRDPDLIYPGQVFDLPGD